MTEPVDILDAARAALRRAGGGTAFNALAETTDPFAAAVYASHVAIVVTDPRQPDNPIIFANDAFCKLTGYSQVEIIGQNCRFLQGPLTDPATVARIRQAVAAGRPIEVDLRNHRKDGTPFWNRLVISPVHDATGALSYFVATQYDVTIEVEQLPNLEARNDALLATLAERLMALEESEARFRHMADNAPVMVWTGDVTGACTWLSQSWSAFTGQELAAGLGSGWLDVIHPEDRSMVEQAFEGAEAIQGPVRVEYRLRRANGSYAWVIDAAVPRTGDYGAPMGYVGSVLDITDRRTAEARLELSEESLRLATDAAEIGTWDFDVATGTLSSSARAAAMFGMSSRPVSTLEAFRAAIHPSDRLASATAFAAMINPATRSAYEHEFRAIGQDDDAAVQWVAVKGKGLFTPDGRCLRAIGTAIDITARKAAQARQTVLLTVADKVRTLTDAGAIAMATREVLGQHFQTTHVGFVAVRRGNAPINAPIFEGTNDESAESAVLLSALDAKLLSTLARGKILVCNDRGDEPNATCNPCGALGLGALLLMPLMREGALAALLYVGLPQPHRWPDEERTLLEHVAARAWDAMERTRAEAALRELNATLESRVEERTAELQSAEESLRQAQKMEAVGQLTGGIAHDFNNLLTGIVGALDLLQRRIRAGRTDGLERYADIAINSAQRAGALTQRLLAFARRQPLDPRPTDANKLIASMEDLLRRTLGPAVELELLLGQGLWPTLCDANQLESAILNLAINARDAMPDGGRLTIETANATLDETYARGQGGEVRSGQYTAISVQDTGTGMSPDVIGRVFEPFFTTKPIGQGTGLGLSMLYGFAQQSHGHVRVYSEIGQGTIFRLYLPRHGGVLEAPDRAAPPPVAVESDTHGTVLVIEDESAVRALIVETLAELGYTALEAGDGPAGLRILQSEARVDLLVTDVGLPGLDGRQVADAARVLRPGLRVLFITGYAYNTAIGNEVLEPGMEMMTKPFAMDALAMKIRGMVTGG